MVESALGDSSVDAHVAVNDLQQICSTAKGSCMTVPRCAYSVRPVQHVASLQRVGTLQSCIHSDCQSCQGRAHLGDIEINMTHDVDCLYMSDIDFINQSLKAAFRCLKAAMHGDSAAVRMNQAAMIILDTVSAVNAHDPNIAASRQPCLQMLN